MTTFKPCVQKKRADGFYQVYIRVTHNCKVGYIKTDKAVAKKDLTKTKEIKDHFVLSYCTQLIIRYNERLNTKDTSLWSVKDVIDFLVDERTELSFSEYARLHIRRLCNANHERNARDYKSAVQHLERFIGTTNVLFAHLTSAVINRWIQSMAETHRAKEQYPICVRQIFKAAVLEYNDYDIGRIRIQTNPWPKVQIPKADVAEKKAISPEACRDFFAAPLPESDLKYPLAELGKDVAMMVLCLAGINAIDLYNMQKTDYRNGLLCYKRAKTKHARSDEAYFEIRIEPIIQPIIEKYLAEPNDPYLFSFHKRYSTNDSFNSNVNGGIKQICRSLGITERPYCVYTFRHTWATVAQNDCGASISEVAFGMNHTNGYRVTRGYVRLDFTPAWELNAKVIDFIFFSNAKSKQGYARDLNMPLDKLFRLSPKRMVYARAYFKGEILAELSDIGFNKVDDVIAQLVAQLPTTIPDGCAVQFRIKDVDLDKEAVYLRTKGKGF